VARLPIRSSCSSERSPPHTNSVVQLALGIDDLAARRADVGLELGSQSRLKLAMSQEACEKGLGWALRWLLPVNRANPSVPINRVSQRALARARPRGAVLRQRRGP